MVGRPTRRCVIVRDPLRSGDFIAALQASLSPEDPLEIILDRRQRGSSGLPDLVVDRRQQSQVDDALETTGFAIVPTSADRAEDDTVLSLQPSETPIEQPFVEEDDQLVEGDSSSQGRRSGAVIRILAAFSGLTMTALVLLLGSRITGHDLISQLFTASSSIVPRQPRGQTREPLTAEPLLAPVSDTTAAAKAPAERTTNHSPTYSNSASASTDNPSSTSPASSRGDNTGTPGRRETGSHSEVTSPALRALHARSHDTVQQQEEASSASRGESTGSDETGAPPKGEGDEGASGGRPRPSAPARHAPGASVRSKQVSGVSSAEMTTPDAVPTRSEDRLRAELVGGPVSRGWGNSYAVRLLSPAGAPMKVSGVVLVAHMADRSVEEIAMGALPEPGIYRGTVPTGRSTPVDLRVRVRTSGDKFVEIAVMP